MKLMIDRAWKKSTYTISRLFIDGARFYEALEDKDRGLKKTDLLSTIQSKKVYGETAIPSGVYEIALSVSEKFKNRTWAKKYNGIVPEILGVPGFSGVRIHPFNRPEESFGCIGVGQNRITGMITNSTKCYYELMDKYLIPATNRKEKITIEIL